MSAQDDAILMDIMGLSDLPEDSDALSDDETQRYEDLMEDNPVAMMAVMALEQGHHVLEQVAPDKALADRLQKLGFHNPIFDELSDDEFGQILNQMLLYVAMKSTYGLPDEESSLPPLPPNTVFEATVSMFPDTELAREGISRLSLMFESLILDQNTVGLPQKPLIWRPFELDHHVTLNVASDSIMTPYVGPGEAHLSQDDVSGRISSFGLKRYDEFLEMFQNWMLSHSGPALIVHLENMFLRLHAEYSTEDGSITLTLEF